LNGSTLCPDFRLAFFQSVRCGEAIHGSTKLTMSGTNSASILSIIEGWIFYSALSKLLKRVSRRRARKIDERRRTEQVRCSEAIERNAEA
jgi:hypothetical protein